MSWLTCSNHVDRHHNDSEVGIRIWTIDRVQQGSFPYKQCLILFTHGVGNSDIVAQDGYPLQSEGRTPGDEGSGGVDKKHTNITNWL